MMTNPYTRNMITDPAKGTYVDGPVKLDVRFFTGDANTDTNVRETTDDMLREGFRPVYSFRGPNSTFVVFGYTGK